MAMQDQVNATLTPHRRVPWNKGKVTGAKPPLRPKHVWSIRTKLQIEGRARDLAMFNLAIDSKLRGCDVVAIKVEDIAASGYTADRATVRQKKTGRPVRFELTEQTRQAVDDYLKVANKRPGEFLFTRSAFPWFESYQAASASLYDQVWMTGWRFTSSMPAIMRSLSSCFEVTRMWRKTERANLEKKPSMRLSHEPCLGVKVNSKRPGGRASSQAVVSLDMCAE